MMSEFWNNLNGIDIPAMRKKRNIANAYWIQRNLYFRNDSEQARKLEEEVRAYVRLEHFKRDSVNKHPSA
jgi:hypothetical protein